MTIIDWVILCLYLVGMVGLSLYLAKGQRDDADYYVGGRKLPWWAVGISTMATQTSANSFIGIPAFVALKPGGGLTWLQYELAVPLAMIFVMVFLLPLFRELQLISVYEYLELRFDRATRSVMSAIFLLSRGLATGVGVYAAAVVLEVCLGIPVWACIVLVGGVTVLYDTLGGMAAVVYSDVIQLVILVGGIVLCTYLALADVGGFYGAIAAHEPERLVGFDPGHGVYDGARVPFWGFLVGGFCLYVSYYGVDQSQAQRFLSAPDIASSKRALMLNGFARFPLTLLYLLMGLAIGAAFWKSPELRDAVPADRLDSLVPQFVLQRLPTGARGVLFAAILAAAMSSLDSALNSLSAATMRDFVEPIFRPKRVLVWSKVTTIVWGVLITGFAFAVGDVSDTVVEGINKLGAFFYGPLLAAFLSGILDRRARGPAMLTGVLVGVLTNFLLFFFFDDGLYWMWWNLTGLLTAIVTPALGSRLMAPPRAEALTGTVLTWQRVAVGEKHWRVTYLGLAFYFVFIAAVSLGIGPLLLGLRALL